VSKKAEKELWQETGASKARKVAPAPQTTCHAKDNGDGYPIGMQTEQTPELGLHFTRGSNSVLRVYETECEKFGVM